jgi:hypothetical protein
MGLFHHECFEKSVELPCYQNKMGQFHVKKPVLDDFLWFGFVLMKELRWVCLIQKTPEASIQIGHYAYYFY